MSNPPDTHHTECKCKPECTCQPDYQCGKYQDRYQYCDLLRNGNPKQNLDAARAAKNKAYKAWQDTFPKVNIIPEFQSPYLSHYEVSKLPGGTMSQTVPDPVPIPIAQEWKLVKLAKHLGIGVILPVILLITVLGGLSLFLNFWLLWTLSFPFVYFTARPRAEKEARQERKKHIGLTKKHSGNTCTRAHFDCEEETTDPIFSSPEEAEDYMRRARAW